MIRNILVVISIVLSFFSLTNTAFAKEAIDNKRPSEFPVGSLKSDNGNKFELSGSPYLDISVESSKKIDVKITSIPEIILVQVSRTEKTNGNSTDITISNLKPDTKYYKYEDSYKNLTEFISDDSGRFLYKQDLKKRSSRNHKN